MSINYSSSIHISRAQHLMSQSRYDNAITELQQHLTEEPDDPWAHGMMSVAYSLLHNGKEALRWADQAVQLGPNVGYSHWGRALALSTLEKYKEAEASAVEAIRLSPFDPGYYSMLGHIRSDRQDWKGALEAAEAGLALDAEHSGCINVRAFALMRQGKKDYAEAAIQSALANDPEDAVSHTNQGWICLNRGDRDRALTHFKEALRINPNIESARRGILEALANKYIIYRWLYNYFEWMATFNSQVRMGIVIGGYLLFRGLVYISNGAVELTIVAFYGFFAFLTWTGRSSFDLLLRLNPLGRLALNRKQIIASNWVGLCLAGIIISVVLSFVKDLSSPILAAVCFGFLAIPGAKIARTRGDILISNIACAVLFLAVVGLETIGIITQDSMIWPGKALTLLGYCGVAYTWIAGFLVRS